MKLLKNFWSYWLYLLLYYNFHKINLNCGGSYIDSPDWIKNKKPSINPVSNDDKFVQYAKTVVLNRGKIRLNPERILQIKPFISKDYWKGTNCQSGRKGKKKFDKQIKQSLLMCYMLKNEYIYMYPAYVLKNN